MKQLITILCVLLITGCQATDPLSAKNDPKSEWWELAFTEPDYMKVWVEDSAVEDINGKLFTRTGEVQPLVVNQRMAKSPRAVGMR